MSYKDRTRKTITLPSGATAVIRKFTTFDSMRAGNPPPRARLRAQGKLTKDDPHSPEEIEYTILANTYIAVECCLTYTIDGEKLMIVDCNPRNIEDNAPEIAACEVPPEDMQEIVQSILKFSGAKPEEAAENGRIFPAEQDADGAIASPR